MFVFEPHGAELRLRSGSNSHRYMADKLRRVLRSYVTVFISVLFIKYQTIYMFFLFIVSYWFAILLPPHLHHHACHSVAIIFAYAVRKSAIIVPTTLSPCGRIGKQSRRYHHTKITRKITLTLLHPRHNITTMWYKFFENTVAPIDRKKDVHGFLYY